MLFHIHQVLSARLLNVENKAKNRKQKIGLLKLIVGYIQLSFFQTRLIHGVLIRLQSSIFISIYRTFENRLKTSDLHFHYQENSQFNLNYDDQIFTGMIFLKVILSNTIVLIVSYQY